MSIARRLDVDIGDANDEQGAQGTTLSNINELLERGAQRAGNELRFKNTS